MKYFMVVFSILKSTWFGIQNRMVKFEVNWGVGGCAVQ